MKKILCLTAMLIFATATLAVATPTEVTTYPSPKFTASSNVHVWAAANATQFTAISKHLNGTRTYGVSSGGTQIMYTESVLPGTNISSSNLSTSDSATAFSGWSSM